MTPIGRIRKEVLGISQAKLAAIAGVTQATVSRWERGELSPSLSELTLIREHARQQRIKLSDSAFFPALSSPSRPSVAA